MLLPNPSVPLTASLNQDVHVTPETIQSVALNCGLSDTFVDSVENVFRMLEEIDEERELLIRTIDRLKRDKTELKTELDYVRGLLPASVQEQVLKQQRDRRAHETKKLLLDAASTTETESMPQRRIPERQPVQDNILAADGRPDNHHHHQQQQKRRWFGLF